MDLFKIIIVKGLENDNMRSVTQPLQSDNEELRKRIVDDAKKVPPCEAKYNKSVKALREEVTSVKTRNDRLLKKIEEANKTVF